MFHDDRGIPIGSHRARDPVEWHHFALGWSVSSRMAVDEGPYMHTRTMFEEEREGFIGNVSEVVGDVTFIALVGGFRNYESFRRNRIR